MSDRQISLVKQDTKKKTKRKISPERGLVEEKIKRIILFVLKIKYGSNKRRLLSTAREMNC